MRLISALIKNSIKLDFKMLIPFFATIVIIVLVISSSAVSNDLFVNESREPAIIKYGGEVSVYKSHQQADFVMSDRGLVAKWYPHLFEPAEIEGFATDDVVTYDLSIWGKHNFLFQLDGELIGRSYQSSSPTWEITKGQVDNSRSMAEWESNGRPVSILMGDKLPLELREQITIGREFYAYIPKIIESGGVINLKGMSNTAILPKDAFGMDYLDYENGQWVALTVAAIGRDGLGGVTSASIIFPLEILQELTGAGTQVNRAGIRMVDGTDDDLAILADDITTKYDHFYGLRTTDMFISTFKSVRDLEEQADMLMYATYLIGSLMVTCVLVLMLRNRRASDVQLITLGINRASLATVAVVEIFIVSILSVLVGITLPALISLIRSGGLALDMTQISRFMLIVPFNLIVTIVVSQIMLPSSKQCLEVLRNE